MSNPHLTAAWKVEGIKPTEKLVLVRLADRADSKGEAYPGLDSLAKECCLHRATVIRALRGLVGHDLIEIEQGGGRKKANRYRLKGSQCATESQGRKGRSVRQNEGEKGSHSAQKGSQPAHENAEKGRTLSRKQSHSATRTIIEPKVKSNPQEPKAFLLPDWLASDIWHEFIEHRRQLKAPMTDTAKARAIAKLSGLKDEGHDPAAVLDQSMVNGWKGLFPINGNVRKDQPARLERDTDEDAERQNLETLRRLEESS